MIEYIENRIFKYVIMLFLILISAGAAATLC